MRRPPDWMKLPADDRILEFFGSHDIILSPIVVAKNMDYGQQYVRERVRELTNYGLLDKESRGYYRINDQGRAYLDGEIEPDEIGGDSE